LKIYFEPQINMVEELDVIEFIEFSHQNSFNLPHKIGKFKSCPRLILVKIV